MTLLLTSDNTPRLRTGTIIDILLLPEMAFTGYVFENRVELEPFAEKVEVQADGVVLKEEGVTCPTLEWAQRVGIHFNNHLACVTIAS